MTSELLHQVREACRQQLLDTLMTLTRENGVDYNDYYRDEHGIDEDEGYTIVKVFDIACFGCHMALPLKWRDDLENDIDPTPEQLADEFGYHAYWSLYIERDETGYDTLMIYQFYNSGANWQGELAEPDHHPASDLSLAELDYLTQAIYWHLKKDVENENENEDERLPEITEPKEVELYSIEPDGKGGKQIHIFAFTYASDNDTEDYWRFTEGTFIIVPLQEFIDNLKADVDYVGRLWGETKQYEGDRTEQEIVNDINHYFNGKTANAELHYSEITMDTPIGDYISC